MLGSDHASGVLWCVGVPGSSERRPNGYPMATLSADASRHHEGMSPSKQRSKGTGSVYQNSRGQWVAAIEVGWTVRGTRRRLTLKARTEAGAQARLGEAQRRIAMEGPAATFAAVTMKRWADQWLLQRQQVVRPGTFISDRSAVRRWIVPTIGDRKSVV